MSGMCESCTKRDGCKKDIGFIFGFCNTDYETEKENLNKTQEKG